MKIQTKIETNEKKEKTMRRKRKENNVNGIACTAAKKQS